MRRLYAVVFATLVMLGQASLGTAAPEATPRAELRVVALDGVLTEPDSLLGIQVLVRNPGPGPVEDLQVTATLHRPAASRSVFQHAMDTGEVGQPVRALQPVTVETLVAKASHLVEMRASAHQLALDDAGAQGVYPLQIRLERRGAPLDRVTTSVVVAPAALGQPVRLALLVPIDHAPGLLADGTYHPRLSGALATGGALDVVSRELQAQADIPLTLAPSGYLLEQALDLTDGYQAVSAAGQAARQVSPEDQAARDAGAFLGRVREVATRPGVEEVALTYGPADLVALVRAGLGSEAKRELIEGVGAVERATGQQVLRGTLLAPQGLDPATLQLVGNEAVRTVILGEQSLRTSEGRIPTTPSPVRRLESGQTALVPDASLAELLARPPDAAGSVVLAQRIIADTAAVYFERPFASAPRGLLVSTPLAWGPPEGLLTELLRRLRTASWLRPVDLSDLVRDVDADAGVTLVYPRDAQRRELEPEYLNDLAEARAALGSLAAALPAGDPMAGRFDRVLLAAAALWYREGELSPDGAARSAEVRAAVADLYAGIHVVEDQLVTLTSIDDQQVPVTIASRARVPLRVRVRLEASPIAFEEGNVQVVVLQPGAPTTLTFPVRVLTPGGTFATRVFVEDPAGGQQLAQGSIQVRSAAYSIVALVLTAGAGLFLLVWWLREVLLGRGWGQRRAQPALVSSGIVQPHRIHSTADAEPGPRPERDERSQ